MVDEGDLYVKRLRDRSQRHTTRHLSDCYSKSLNKKRLSIMEEIYKSSISPPAESKFAGNPFEKEFSMTSSRNDNCDGFNTTETRYPASTSTSTLTRGSSTEILDGVRTYRVEITPRLKGSSIDAPSRPAVNADDKSLSPAADNNSNVIQYRHSNQFHHDMSEVLEERESERSSLSNEQKDPLNVPRSRQSKISIGEYFGAPSHKELITQNFLGQIYNKDLESNQSEHRKSTGPELLFDARVLEIIEPEVVHVGHKSSDDYSQRHTSNVATLREKFEELRIEPPDSTVATSFISEEEEEMLEARNSTQQTTPQRQMEQPQVIADTPKRLYPDLELMRSSEKRQEVLQKSPQGIAETPKRLYPDHELRRISDKFATRKLFHSNDVAKNVHLDAEMYSNQAEVFAKEEIKRNGSEKPATPVGESLFKTAHSIPPSQIKKSQETRHHNASTSSFIKRNMSFVVDYLPKFGRHHRPNHESTRKVGQNENKTTSPLSHSSTISTLTLPNTPSSPPTYGDTDRQNQLQNINVHSERMEGSLPFEVENFLEMALGDERYNSTFTFDHADLRDRTNSHLNASELLSRDRTPMTARFSRVTKVPMSEPPKHSSTLNRTLSLYKTLTQRIKKRFRGSIKDEIRPLERTALPMDINPLNESVKRLLNTVEIQQTYIYQASKALDLCESMPEFAGSRERVESERQLLLATLRKAAAVEEIYRITSHRSEDRPCSERAEVKVCSLSLQLREEMLRRERQSGSIVEWYLAVINEGPFVWATEAVPSPENGSRLYFGGELVIPNLTPNFRITLRVYSLKLQQVVYNHEEKYHIPIRHEDDSDMASTTCPSPNKLLRRSSVRRRSLVSTRQFDIRFSGIRESSFALCGTVQLMLHDLNLSPPWPLIGVPPRSVLRGTVDLNLTHRLQLAASHTGFLTFGEEVAGLAVWNRRWCVLDNHRLLFWNYSSEQDCKNPICIIDLSHCVSPRISLAERSLCAKPRTLLIETSRRRDAVDRDSLIIEGRSSRTVVRSLLSFDNNQDLMEWQCKLNYVVAALREWNMIVN